MRKDKLSIVLASVRAKLVRGGLGKTNVERISAETLLAMAIDMQYISGKRGKDGGYLATDMGLAFIGENVEFFRAQEAKEARAKEVHAKEARKKAVKTRAAQLQDSLTNASAKIAA